MEQSISILDKDYSRWISELSSRYRRSQIKAAVKAYTEIVPQLGEHFTQQVAEQINLELFSVPFNSSSHLFLKSQREGLVVRPMISSN